VVNPDLIVDFVNTFDLRPSVDRLDSPARLGAWLGERGLLPADAPVTAAELHDAVELREALRILLGTHNGVDGDVASASATIDRAACRASLGVRFRDGVLRLEPGAGGVPGALGSLVGEAATAMTNGTRERLKICRADDCHWAFVDTARNQSRAWCSMQSCGNREKVRAYRARHGHGPDSH
jgi:predicted RNA-binding Zn ribbon-like protein